MNKYSFGAAFLGVVAVACIAAGSFYAFHLSSSVVSIKNMSITNSYEFLPTNGQPPKQIVLLLHGVGSNGRDLIGLAPVLAQALPEAVFVSPDAPFPCDMVPPGYPDSYQWFSLQDRDPHKMLAGVQAVFPLVEAFIDEQLKKYNLSADKLALLGFSQGTMTSLYVGPRYKDKIAGILGYSGALIWESDVKDEDLSKVPVHLIHGEADEVVPVQARKMAQERLEKHGFTVTGHTTPGLAHGIDQAGIEGGAAFLSSIL